jgi:hypothetical protein
MYVWKTSCTETTNLTKAKHDMNDDHVMVHTNVVYFFVWNQKSKMASQHRIESDSWIYKNFFSETEQLMKTYNVIYTNDNGSNFTK